MYQSYGKLSTLYYQKSKPIAHEIMGDIGFYQSQLKKTQGPILEAGVGTGRMLIPLLQAGLHVEGIDYSKAMLEVCQQACKQANLNPKLKQQDLNTLSMTDYYDAIIMPTGSFMLLDQAKLVLERFYQALTNEGKIIFDLEPFQSFDVSKQSISELAIDDDEGLLLHTLNCEHNHIEQYTKQLLKYEYYIKGELIETELQDFTLYYYGIKEITYMLHEVGFKSITLISNYNKSNKIDTDTTMLTIIAHKKEQGL